MEIKQKHQIIIALTLGALAFVMLWPASTIGTFYGGTWSGGNHYRSAAGLVKTQRARASAALYKARSIEHALSATVDANASDGPVIVAHDGVPAVVVQHLTSRMTKHWLALGRPNKSKLVIDVNVDVGKRAAGEEWRGRNTMVSRTVAPVIADNGVTCVMVVTLGRGAVNRLNRAPAEVGRTLRPGSTGHDIDLSLCGFYAAFGAPGPAISAWLDATDNYLSTVGQFRDRAHDETLAHLSHRAWAFTPEPLGCLNGNEAACLAAVKIGGASGTPQPGMRWGYNVRTGVFNAETPYYLADMVDRLGAEKFERFWTSGLSLEAAFENAAGETLGAYTANWVQASIGQLDSTADLGFGSVILTIMVAGLGATAAAGVAVRRTI